MSRVPAYVVKSIFMKYDVDNSNEIDVAEFSNLLGDLGMGDITKEQRAGLLMLFDANNSGVIDL